MSHSMVMTRCPSTGHEIATGITSDWVTFNNLSGEPKRLQCPHCGDEHHWTVAEAWLAAIAISSSPAQSNAKQSGWD
jgi:hypothetical protein